MSSVQPRKGEKLILQEDCSEDHLKNGLLTLTNQRIFFEKTEGTLATLSKRTGELLVDISLNEIKKNSTYIHEKLERIVEWKSELIL